MRWQRGRRSDNVEDRRGQKAGIGAKGKLGLGGTVVVLLLALVFGKDALVLLEGGSSGSGASSEVGEIPPPPAADAELAEFIKVVLGYTEDTWNQKFAETGRSYREPKLILFSDSIRSACGFSSAAIGPFYCPGDEKVYIDLGFFRALKNQLGAPGDFAQAYVIAHEIGHHVQVLTGLSAEVSRRSRGESKKKKNELSVRQELQADCYAGVWANSVKERNLLEIGDIEEAMKSWSYATDSGIHRHWLSGKAISITI